MTETQRDDTETALGDDRLLLAVQEGDGDAYALLYERHSAAARRLARQLVRGETEVDDAVSEAFTGVLGVIQRGDGPRHGFRSYLLASVRNACHDRFRRERRQIVTDDMDSLDQGTPFIDPAVKNLERSLIARAFRSLPQRWQVVLWHTEIEGEKPSAVADVLGMSANSVAALAYRAREGLRQAYLQLHLAENAGAKACRPALERLGAYVRGSLAKRDRARVDQHLGDCSDCRSAHAELMDVNVALRGIVAPLLLGPVAADYLAALPSAALSGSTPFQGFWWHLTERQQQLLAEGGAVTTAAATVALTLFGAHMELPAVPEVPPAAVDSVPQQGHGGLEVPPPALEPLGQPYTPSPVEEPSAASLFPPGPALGRLGSPVVAQTDPVASSARKRCLATGGSAPPEGSPAETRGTAASTWWRLPVVPIGPTHPVFPGDRGAGVFRDVEECEWTDPEETSAESSGANGGGRPASAPESASSAGNASKPDNAAPQGARPAEASANNTGNAAPPASAKGAASNSSQNPPPGRGADASGDQRGRPADGPGHRPQ